MIKLEKGPAPQKLVKNFTKWTDSLMDKVNSGQEPTATERTRYRDPEIKQALIQETHKKCAYCESFLRHIHHGDVEHIYPKSLAVERSFEWENLTLSCEVCNQNKSDNDPLLENIIDPYLANPADHICFIGSLAFSTGSVAGISTIALLELNRPDLREVRSDRVEKLVAIFQKVTDRALPPVVRKAILDDLINVETAPSAPYSSMARCVIDQMQSVVDLTDIANPAAAHA